MVYGGLGSTEHCVQLCVLTIIGCNECTVEPLYKGHNFSPYYRGFLNLEVILYTSVLHWDTEWCPFCRGFHISEVCNREVPLYLVHVMVVWVVLNIVYSCVCSPLLDVMNVLGTRYGYLVNGQIFLDEFYFLHTCVLFHLLTQFTLTSPSPHPLLLHVMEM